jgi:hypothetical protein
MWNIELIQIKTDYQKLVTLRMSHMRGVGYKKETKMNMVDALSLKE